MNLVVPAVVVYLGAHALLTAGLASPACRRRLGGEARRKALHVAMGLLAVPFPWVFPTPVPVLVLAALAAVALTALRLVPGLRARFGPALHGVERASAGDLAFVAGVALTFVLAGGSARLYVVPLLLLTLADPAAALLGRRGGSTSWPWARGAKTVVGSAVFAAVAFGIVAVGLWLAGDVPPASAIVVALAAALGTALVESLAGRGLDNLFVPVAGSLLLDVLTRAEPSAAAAAVGALALVAVAGGAGHPARTAEARS